MIERRSMCWAVLGLFLMATLAACAPQPTPAPEPTALPPAATPVMEEPTSEPADEPRYGGSITIGIPSDITTFDPPVMWSPREWSALQMVSNGLYRWRYGTAEVEPEIASAMPEISEGGTLWTIRLRQDVKFSNGAPLTARDVKYTWDRMLDDGTGCWAASYYMAVKGAAEAFAGTADGVAGVQVVDDYTVQFELVEPIAYFDKLLAMPWTYIMNQSHVEEVGDQIGLQPMGAGPFVLAAYEPAVRAVFEKNPGYFRGDEPYLDTVTFELGVDSSVAALRVEKGELDALLEKLPPLEFRRLQDDPNFKGEALRIEWPDTFLMAINTAQPQLSDVRVRQAIAHCIDREAIVRAVAAGMGSPAHTILPPSDALAYNADQPFYEYDTGKAKALLAEAGYADGLSVNACAAQFYPYADMAQVVQGQLSECGITLNLTLGEPATVLECISDGTSGFVFSHWGYEIPDPSYILDGGFTKAAFFPESCCNWSRYWNQDLEDALSAARTEPDAVRRGQMYQDLDQQLIYDLVLWVPLWHEGEWYAVSENLGGFKPPLAMHGRMVEPQYYWSKSGK